MEGDPFHLTGAAGAWQCLSHNLRDQWNQLTFLGGSCYFNLSIWLMLGYVARSKICEYMSVDMHTHKHTHSHTLRKCKVDAAQMLDVRYQWWLMSWMQSTDILGLALSENLGWINSQHFKNWKISSKTPDSWPLPHSYLVWWTGWKRVVDGSFWDRACTVQFFTFITTLIIITAITISLCHLSPKDIYICNSHYM